MNKKWIALLFLVLCVGVGLYQVVLGKNTQASQEFASLKKLNIPNLNSDSIASKSALERDPYDALLLKRKVVKRKIRKRVIKKAEVKKVVVVPRFRVSSILGGKTPLAIVKKGGETKFIRAGDEVWGWTVESIGSEGVQLTQEDSEYLLKP